MGLSEKIRREYERIKKEPDYEKAALFISLRQKRKRVEQIINLHAAGSFTVGLIPIPFSDGPILLANQAALFARIMVVYDMDGLSETIFALIGQIGIGKLLSQNLAQGAKYLTAQALKLVPTIGTVAGGVINGAIAASATFAFGMALSEFCYQRLKTHSKSSSITREDIESFNQTFSKSFMRHCSEDSEYGLEGIM